MNYSTRVVLGVKDCHLELDEKHFTEPIEDQGLDGPRAEPRAGRRLGREPPHRGREPLHQHLFLRRRPGDDPRRPASPVELDSPPPLFPACKDVVAGFGFWPG